RLTVLAERRRDGFVEQGQVERLDVDQLERGVRARVRNVDDPARDGFAEAAWPRAAQNDGDFQHEFLTTLDFRGVVQRARRGVAAGRWRSTHSVTRRLWWSSQQSVGTADTFPAR